MSYRKIGLGAATEYLSLDAECDGKRSGPSGGLGQVNVL